MQFGLTVRLLGICLAAIAIFWLVSVGEIINKILLQLVSMADYPTNKHPAVDVFTSMAVIVVANLTACISFIAWQIRYIFTNFIVILKRR